MAVAAGSRGSDGGGERERRRREVEGIKEVAPVTERKGVAAARARKERRRRRRACSPN